jgi:protochlorophyllide reductase
MTSAAAGRRILLTGASSGIGRAAALTLREAGHRLLLPCRDGATAAALARHLDLDPSQTPVADLADLDAVHQLAGLLLERDEPLDSLVLNAGLQYAGAREPRWSAQGFELTLAVNQLAHQCQLERLLPLLGCGQHPRVVITASEVHDPTTPGGRVGPPAGLGDLGGLAAGPGAPMIDSQSPFHAEKAYKDSKLANMLLARELARRLQTAGTPMPVIAWSPGLVIPRGQGGFFRHSRGHNPVGQALFALVARDLLRVTATPERAGERLAALASGPEHGTPGFQYWSQRVEGPGRLRFAPAEPSEEANDEVRASRLWTLCAGLIGPSAEPADHPTDEAGQEHGRRPGII